VGILYSDTGRRRHNLFPKNLTHVDVKKGLANKAGTDDSRRGLCPPGKNTDRESCQGPCTDAHTPPNSKALAAELAVSTQQRQGLQ